MTRQRLSQLFALAAIILMIIAAFVLHPPSSGALRKGYILNLRSLERITEPSSQWANAYAFQLIAGDGTPVKLGLGLMLAGGILLGLSLNLGKTTPMFAEGLGDMSPTPLSTQWGGAGAGDNSATPLPMFAEGLGVGSDASPTPLSTQWGGAGGGDNSIAPPRLPKIGYIRLLIGLICLAILTERNGNLFKIHLLRDLNVHAQAALLFFGLIFTTWGLIGHLPRLKTNRGVRIEFLALAFITLLALILRLWRLGTAIHGLIDEMHFINAVTLLWKFPDDIRILQPFSNIPAFPWVFPYMQWGSTEIFGNDLIGLRIISVLMGTATIPLLYLLARSLFDKPTALIAALILATFPPHIHFSRAGINNIADPLVGTAALAFLAYGLRTRRRWPFVLAGVSLGLTQYFYDGGRLLYPTLTLTWLLLAGLIWRLSKSAPSQPLATKSVREVAPSSPSPVGEGVGGEVVSSPLPMFGEGLGVGSDASPTPLSTQWGGVGGGDFSPSVTAGHPRRRHLLLFLLAFLLIATPIYYTRYGLDSGFSSRGRDVSAGQDFWRTVLVEKGGDLIYLRHLSYTFLIYLYMPEMSWFYGGHTPLILHAFVPLFLLGLFWVLWHWRQSGPLLLILWLILVAFGNTLLRESGTSARYVVVFPALALFMAIGLRQSVALLLSDLWPQHAQLAVLALVVTAVAVGQTGYYFDRHIDAWNNGRLALDDDDAMFRAVDLPPNTQVHIINPIEIIPFNIETLKTYLGRPDLQVDGLYPEGLTDAYLDNLPRNVNHAFFLPPDRYDLLVLLVHYFELDPPQFSPYNVPRRFQLVLYFAPASRNHDYPGEEAWLRRNPLE